MALSKWRTSCFPSGMLQYFNEIDFAGPDIHQLPGYQVNDYKIILIPPENLVHRIIKLRSGFNEKFNVENTVPGMPQIILAGFKQIKAFEERLINRLRIIAMAFQPFKIEFNDFGCFPSHTIFLDFINKIPVEQLARKIRSDAQRLMKLDDNKPQFLSEAHLTIAAKLKPAQFEKAWDEYSEKQFKGKFIAARMLLLRRKKNESNFSPIANFDFMNLPIDVKQGTLF